MKHLSLNACLALLVACMALSANATSQIVQTLTYSYSNMHYATVTANGTSWLDVSYNGIGASAETGAPILPCHYLTISVPYNAVNIQVDAESNDYTGAIINKKVLPAQPAYEICDSTNHPFAVDSTIFMTNAYYPSQLARIVSEGYYMGENHLVTVAVFPVEYNPVNNHLRVNIEIDLTVSYDLSNDVTASDLIVSNNTETRGRYMELTSALVANPDDVQNNAISMPSTPSYTQWYIPDSAAIDTIGDVQLQEMFRPSDPCYLIVTTSGMENSLKRIKALKRQKGYKTSIVTVDDIVSDERVQDGDVITVDGDTVSVINDDAGKIRQYLKRSFRLGTRYVMLAGKSVPFRYFYANQTDTKYWSPTDWYFSELNTDWERCVSTKTIYFNKIDMYPELYIGRLPASRNKDLEKYAKKLVIYELNPGGGDTEYLSRAFFTQCDLMQQFDEANFAYGFISNKIPLYCLMEEINGSHPTGPMAIDSLKHNPSGLISFHGHGSPHSISVNFIPVPPRTIIAKEEYHSYGLPEVGRGIDLVISPFKPGIQYSMACTTIPYDDYHRDGDKQTMGESYIFGENYGGVAYLGNTRDGTTLSNHTNCSVSLEANFYSLISSGMTKIGMAETECKSPTHKSNYLSLSGSNSIMYRHNLLGDPEVEMWTSQPQSYSDILVNRTDNTITVSGISSPGVAYVGLCCNEGFTALDTTSTGSVTFTGVRPNSTVMVYQHNYLPYIAPLSLQNTTIKKSQYVFATDVILGNHVDGNRTSGDVVIKSGVEYEIEHNGTVVLAPGFKVEKGAKFATIRSDYR